MYLWRNKKIYQYFWIEKKALTGAMVKVSYIYGKYDIQQCMSYTLATTVFNAKHATGR